MADYVLLTGASDTTEIHARLRELGAVLTYSMLADKVLRASVRLPNDPEAAAECRRLVDEWNRDL